MVTMLKKKKKSIYIYEPPERRKCRDVFVTCFNILLIDLWLERRQLRRKRR